MKGQFLEAACVLRHACSNNYYYDKTGRTDDLTAIIETIDNAEKFIYIAVADYVPMRIFGEREYWPLIDDRLRMGN